MYAAPLMEIKLAFFAIHIHIIIYCCLKMLLVCVQCVPAVNISPLKNSTAIHLKDLNYYLYADD